MSVGRIESSNVNKSSVSASDKSADALPDTASSVPDAVVGATGNFVFVATVFPARDVCSAVSIAGKLSADTTGPATGPAGRGGMVRCAGMVA